MKVGWEDTPYPTLATAHLPMMLFNYTVSERNYVS